MSKDSWRLWDDNSNYGELLFKRATGELDEMESAKSLCNVLSELYQPGFKLADVGCGAGHYLRSLRNRLDENIDYTGFDATRNYLEYAKRAFPTRAQFLLGDVFDLPSADAQYDIVMSNNLLLHLPPEPGKALSELARIAKKYVVVRTLFSNRNYIIKEIRGNESLVEGNDAPHIDPAHSIEEQPFNYFNMYTKSYMESLVHTLNGVKSVDFIDDDQWKAFDNRELTTRTGTYTHDGFQVSGNLILDWKFLVMTKV